MGPELMMMSSILSAGAGLVGAVGSAGAMKAQAAADQQRAQMEQAWAQRQAREARASGQRDAQIKLHEMEAAQGKLTASAGASGGRADDQTALKLLGDIEGEGRLNAGLAQAGAEQKAAGLEYQGALNRWTADANARIKRSAATSTLIGGVLGAAGTIGQGYSKAYSPMAQRYGDTAQQSYRYG